jgi:hypothetical protein
MNQTLIVAVAFLFTCAVAARCHGQPDASARNGCLRLERTELWTLAWLRRHQFPLVPGLAELDSFRVMVSLSLEAAQTDRQVSIFDCRSHFVARSGFIFAARLPFWIFLACRGFGNAALALRNPSLLAIHTCASLPGFIC